MSSISTSSIGSSLLAALGYNSTSSASTSSTSLDTTTSADSSLLAAMYPSASANTSNDSLLSSIVSLSSQNATPTSQAGATYTAQGLLAMEQSSTLANDSTLFGSIGNTDTSTSASSDLMSLEDALLQANASPQSSNTGTGTSSSSSTATTSATNSAGTASTTNTSANAGLIQMIQQNPSLATTLIQSQMNQSLINLMA